MTGIPNGDRKAVKSAIELERGKNQDSSSESTQTFGTVWMWIRILSLNRIHLLNITNVNKTHVPRVTESLKALNKKVS